MTQWTSFVADVFADIPFSSDLELSGEFQFANFWAGTNTVQSGYEMQGLLALRVRRLRASSDRSTTSTRRPSTWAGATSSATGPSTAAA